MHSPHISAGMSAPAQCLALQQYSRPPLSAHPHMNSCFLCCWDFYPFPFRYPMHICSMHRLSVSRTCRVWGKICWRHSAHANPKTIASPGEPRPPAREGCAGPGGCEGPEGLWGTREGCEGPGRAVREPGELCGTEGTCAGPASLSLVLSPARRSPPRSPAQPWWGCPLRENKQECTDILPTKHSCRVTPCTGASN